MKSSSDRPAERVRVADLKLAIASIPPQPKPHAHLRDWVTFIDAREKAWRSAFMWHVGLIERHAALSDEVGAHITDFIAIDREEEEGMALIRESLV